MNSYCDQSTHTNCNQESIDAKLDVTPTIDIAKWSSEKYASFQLQQCSFIDDNTCTCNYFVRETKNLSSKEYSTEDKNNVKEACFYKGRNNCSLTISPLRSLSLQLGSSLERLCMSHNTNVTNEMLQALCSRFFHLKYLDLTFCNKLTDACCEIISNFCGKTILSLNVSGCHLLTNEACKWISGLNGMKKKCVNLQYLNLSDCIKVGDCGLQSLGGCKNLMYLNVMNCVSLSDRGVHWLAKGCRKLRKISFRGCFRLGDRGIISLSRYCHALVSLNLALCQSITSQSLVMLSKGCMHLQSISLEGILIKPKDVCVFIKKCRDLIILNVTGGDKISKYDILALTKGKKYVRQAKTFFGIVPVEDVLTLLIQTGEINKKIESAICIQVSCQVISYLL